MNTDERKADRIMTKMGRGAKRFTASFWLGNVTSSLVAFGTTPDLLRNIWALTSGRKASIAQFENRSCF